MQVLRFAQDDNDGRCSSFALLTTTNGVQVRVLPFGFAQGDRQVQVLRFAQDDNGAQDDKL